MILICEWAHIIVLEIFLVIFEDFIEIIDYVLSWSLLSDSNFVF